MRQSTVVRRQKKPGSGGGAFTGKAGLGLGKATLVILSEAKDLVFCAVLERPEILRFAQDDRRLDKSAGLTQPLDD